MFKGMMERLALLRIDSSDPINALCRRAESPGGSTLDPFGGSWGMKMATGKIECLKRSIQWFFHDIKYVVTGRE